MLRRRAILVLAVGALAVGLVLLGGAAPVCGESLTVFKLEPSIGWVELPPVNAYASATSEGPLAGWSGAAVAVPVTARAILEPDLRKAMLTAVFVPRSAGIRANAANLFVAPLGRRLEWTLVLTVTNPNDIPMTDVKVRDEFGKAFRATLAGRPAGDARIEGDDPRGMLPLSPTLVWDIGQLGPGEAARAEVTVVTGRDGQGNQQFSREGIYSIDMGARLTYRLAGQLGARNAASASVIARKDMGALRSEGLPFDVDSGSIVNEGGLSTGAGPVVSLEAPAAGRSRGPTVTATVARATRGPATRDIGRITSPISLVAVGLPPGPGLPPNMMEHEGKFVVPMGEFVRWQVTVTIKNEGDSPGWDSWHVAFSFGPELSATVLSKTAPSGDVLTMTRTLPTDPLSVAWQWSGDASQFPPGSEAVLVLEVYTTAGTGYAAAGQYVLTSATTFGSTYPPYGSWVAGLSPIDILAGGLANVTVSATRQDWRVRKAGTYGALCTEMSFTGVGSLTVDFSGFEDLAEQDGGSGEIEAWYGFADDLAAVETTGSGWIAADDLNLDANSRGPIPLDPTTPSVLRMWSKISVGGEDSSCEYEDKGVITFIVAND